MIMLFAALLAAQPIEKKPTADLLVTNQPGTVLLRGQQGRAFGLPNVKTARRGEPIGVLVQFSGCAGDEEGHCNVTTDIVVLDPAGKVYGESKDMEVWVGKPATITRRHSARRGVHGDTDRAHGSGRKVPDQSPRR